MTTSLAAIITALAAVLTLLFGIIQYGITKRSEFRQRFWEEQLRVYRQVCAMTATIATAKDISNLKEHEGEFYRLYWGELGMIEDSTVKDAMIKFSDKFQKVLEEMKDPKTLEQSAYQVARACRESLGKTWDPVGLDDLSEAGPTH